MTPAHVPPPPEATELAEWEDGQHRWFATAHDSTVTGFEGGTIGVRVSGFQLPCGDIVRHGYVSGEGALTAAQLRRVAAACLDAADVIDGW